MLFQNWKQEHIYLFGNTKYLTFSMMYLLYEFSETNMYTKSTCLSHYLSPSTLTIIGHVPKSPNHNLPRSTTGHPVVSKPRNLSRPRSGRQVWAVSPVSCEPARQSISRSFFSQRRVIVLAPVHIRACSLPTPEFNSKSVWFYL